MSKKKIHSCSEIETQQFAQHPHNAVKPESLHNGEWKWLQGRVPKENQKSKKSKHRRPYIISAQIKVAESGPHGLILPRHLRKTLPHGNRHNEQHDPGQQQPEPFAARIVEGKDLIEGLVHGEQSQS